MPDDLKIVLGRTQPIGATEVTVNELISALQKMPRDAEVYSHCAWKEKNAEFDTDFFPVGVVGDMGNVVLFER